MGNCIERPKNNAHNLLINRGTPASDGPKQDSHPLPTPPPQVITYHGKEGAASPRSETEILSSPHLKSFSFNVLKRATRNFNPESLIGEGGFGYVYKGWLDKENLSASRPGDGMVVAVKKLKPEGFQGHKEWLSEVNYLGQLHHPNLVKLIGFCLEGENRLLVYEFMPRGSLENHLFRRGVQPLSWALRIKVAIGAARGLSFLHGSESQVIYRDFKASNILLDSEFNSKLSDFGLAKAGPTGDLTHVSTEVMGTQGYAAPEYLTTGRLTAKCDVYSFGVVLFEILTGRRAVDKKGVGPEQKLLDWVTPQLKNNRKLCRIMDTKLEGQYPQKGAYVAAHLALQCVHDEAKYRPHMADVLAILEKLPSPKSGSAKYNKPSSVEKESLLPEPQPQASPVNSTPRGTSLPAPIKTAMNDQVVVKPLSPPPVKSPPAVSSLPTHMIKNSLPQSPHGR